MSADPIKRFLNNLPLSISDASDQELTEAFLDMDAEQEIRDTAQMVLECRKFSRQPDHHIRYARAWAIRQDPSKTTAAKLIAEKEMDSAQNHFSFSEFHEFKESLPGFSEFWGRWKSNLEEPKP